MITDDRAEQAFEFLLSTVDKIGDAKGRLERAEIMRKRARKKIFVTEDGTVAERDAKAEISVSAQEADAEYIEALIEFEKLKAKREIEDIAIQVWRTEEASRRRA